MTIIYINGNKYNVDGSKNVLQNCLSLNIDVPYFCWHPELGSVGICRLCAVKQYNNFDDHYGKIIMSCISPTVKNLIISTNDIEVKKVHKGIIELLMTNHPHDCPICEEGGNCHLQDMTVLSQHNHRRYIYPKRIYHNQYLGEYISHQMNRCIGCYRCVRYYKDYAGGTDFGVYGSKNNIYFGRFEDGVLENTHSGNLIDVCPTGVFTDKLYSKNYNRKWDLQYSPSICQHCSIGCNIILGSRYGILNKIDNRYHKHLNRYFICDLGRFGYSYVNFKNRIKYPIQFFKNKSTFLKKKNAIELVSNIIKKSNYVLGIGSIRSSIENNFALRKLVRKENFSNGLSSIDNNCIQLILNILKNSDLYTPSLYEVENYDVVLVIGEDITQTSSRMSLSLRQLNKKKQRDINKLKDMPAWHSIAMLNISNNKKKFIYLIYSHETKLDDILSLNYYGSIKNQEIFSFAISDVVNKTSRYINNLNINLKNKVFKIAHALLSCKKPLIISGSHSGSVNLIKAATNIAKGLQNLKKDVGLTLLTPSCNSLGVGVMSMLSVEDILNKIINDKVDTLIVLENDLYRHDMQNKIDYALKRLKNLIVLDHILTPTVQKSTIMLPVSNFAESSGTLINYEGRAQRFFSVYDPIIYNPTTCILESWRWLYNIYYSIYQEYKIDFNLDCVIQEYTKEIVTFKNIKDVAPNSTFRILNQKIARLPHRASGRTAMLSHYNIHEPEQIKDFDTMFNFSMEGHQQPSNNSEYVPFSWAPNWNSIQSWNKYTMNTQHYHSGIRLFKKNISYKKYFFNDILNDNYDKKKWNIIPYYSLFENEELSQKSPIIKKNFFHIYAFINIKYKKILHINENSLIEFDCLNHIFRFLIKFSHKLPLYQIGLPLGCPNIPRILIGRTINNIRGII